MDKEAWWATVHGVAKSRPRLSNLHNPHSPGGGNSSLLQYSCLKTPMDRGAWQTTALRLTDSQTRLSE